MKVATIAIALAVLAGMTSASTTQSTTLNTVGWNPETLHGVRALLEGGSLPDWAQAAKDKLAAEATWRVALPANLRPGVGEGPWSVVDQGPVPPANGTSRDYSTVSGYYWPCNATCPADEFGSDACANGWDQHTGECNVTSGEPWIKHDGFLRSENYEDLNAMIVMMDTVEALTLAWWLLPEHEPSYAQTAVAVLQAWFWDESTGMEPRLEYGGAIPGVYEGTAGAMIAPSFRLGTRLGDCVELLKTAPGDVWTPDDDAGWSAWSSAWLDWMLQSEFGEIELGAVGNHATFLFSHKLAMARATGNDNVVLDVVANLHTGLPGSLVNQILPSGEMPIETARRTGKIYSLMNLNGLFLLGEAAENACRGLPCSPEWDWSWEVTGASSNRWEAYQDNIARCRWKSNTRFPSSVETCKASCLTAAECNTVVVREKYGNLIDCSFQLCSGTLYGHEYSQPGANVYTSYHYVEGPQVGSGSVRNALDFVLSYATGSKSWSEDFPQSIEGSDSSWKDLALPLRIAAGRYNNSSYELDISTVDPSDWFMNHEFSSLLFPPPGSLPPV